MVKEYKILVAIDPKVLQDLVNQHIAEGWQPVGGVAVGALVSTWGSRIYQTMVK